MVVLSFFILLASECSMGTNSVHFLTSPAAPIVEIFNKTYCAKNVKGFLLSEIIWVERNTLIGLRVSPV